MMNDVSKTYKTLRNAERAAAKMAQHPQMIIRQVQRLWSDARFINVAICYSVEALQHGLTLFHAGHGVYVTDWKWLVVEVENMKLPPVTRGLVMHMLTDGGSSQIQPQTFEQPQLTPRILIERRAQGFYTVHEGAAFRCSANFIGDALAQARQLTDNEADIGFRGCTDPRIAKVR